MAFSSSCLKVSLITTNPTVFSKLTSLPYYQNSLRYHFQDNYDPSSPTIVQ